MKNKIKRNIFLLFATITTIVAALPASALANNFDPRSDGGCEGGIIDYLGYISERAGKGEIRSSSEIFNGITCATSIVINDLLVWVTILSVFYIAMSGINYITAAGNEAKTKESIKKIQSALIGYLAFLSVFTMIGLVKSFIQYDAQVNKFKNINIDVNPPT